METIDKWFSREILRWRSGASVTWSIACLPALTLLYMLASSFYIHRPLLSVTEFTSSVCSFSFIGTLVFLMTVNCGYFIYQLSSFTVVPSVSVYRFRHLAQLFSPRIFGHGCVCWLAGIVLGWICTCLLGGRYAGLSNRCEPDSDVYCINEYHLFLVMYGGFTGKMYILYHYVKQNNVIHFPIIQQAKYFQVRQRLVDLFLSSLQHVLWQIKFYYLAYYFLGNIPRDWIVGTLSLNYRSDVRLDSVYGLLFDVGLFWQTLLVGLFIHLSWSLAALLYKVYNTESVEFVISTMFDNFKNKCLVDAMSCTSQPLVQALGYRDLNELAKHSYVRRKELFSLSQPGGHPHNWNKIMSVCLTSLLELNDSVQETNWRILANAPVRQPEKSNSNTSMIGNGDVHNAGAASQTVRQRIVNGIKKRPIMDFFSGETAESKNRNLFASAFLQIWAAQALSALISASYVEDVFGVVQMSMPDILTAMLNLQENVDKHLKLTGGVSRRVQKDSTSGPEQPLKYQLHNALKISIYSIVNKFGKHLMDIGLSLEAEKKLQQFLEYKA